MNRLFITGDVHCPIDIPKLNSDLWEEGKKLTKEDYLIVTGDFGLFWDASYQEIWWRRWLELKPWTTLFVDGNHENFDMLEAYPISEMFGGKVSKLTQSIIWLKRGEVYNIGNRKIFTFGGAMSRDKQNRVPGKSWWFQEIPNMKDVENAEKNLDKHNWEIDIVVSHTAPYYELRTFLPNDIMVDYNIDPTTMMLQEFKDKLKFKEWFFGHLHIDKTEGRFNCLYDDIVEII
jgi:hypothetical protein